MTKISGDLRKTGETQPLTNKSKNVYTPKSTIGKTGRERLNITSVSDQEVGKKISRKDIQSSHANPTITHDKSAKMVQNVTNKKQALETKFNIPASENLRNLKEELSEKKYHFFSRKMNDTTPFESYPLKGKEIKKLEQEVENLTEKLEQVTEEGMRYYEGNGAAQDYPKALEYFKFAADHGDPFAQAMVGKCYFDGTGVTQNYTKAVEYFLISAINGNIDGLNSLGACYHEGLGVKQDFKRALECFEDAAKQNDPDALFFIGQYYYEGNVVAQNFEIAARYFALSTASENLQLEIGNERGKRKENLGNAETALGLAYLSGEGVIRNFDKAFEHLTSAANKGSESAQYCLEYCFKEGKVLPDKVEDVIKARQDAL